MEGARILGDEGKDEGGRGLVCAAVDGELAGWEEGLVVAARGADGSCGGAPLPAENIGTRYKDDMPSGLGAVNSIVAITR